MRRLTGGRRGGRTRVQHALQESVHVFNSLFHHRLLGNIPQPTWAGPPGAELDRVLQGRYHEVAFFRLPGKADDLRIAEGMVVPKRYQSDSRAERLELLRKE